MVRAILIAFAVLQAACGLSWAGSFDLRADVEGLECAILDETPGIVVVHMFIRDAGEVAAVQFGAPKPACWTGATWMADDIVWPVHIGDTQVTQSSGLSVAFGSCQPSPVYLGSMTFYTQGQGAPCCAYPVVKVDDLFPEIPGPIMTVCPNYTDVVGLSGDAMINLDTGCDCPGLVTAVPKSTPRVPGATLYGNDPNPFNPGTTIRYELAAAGPVRLAVYSASGAFVAELVNEPLAAGPHTAKWNGQDARGREVASGVYLSVLEAAGERLTHKMTLLK